MAQATASGAAPKRIGQTGETLAKISIARPVKLGKGIADASLVAQQRTRTRQHRGDVITAIDAVREPLQSVAKLLNEYFFVGANYTYVDSEVTLDAAAGQVQTSLVRPLAGTSENLFNALAEFRMLDYGFSTRLL